MGQVSKEVKDAIIGKAFNRGTTSLRQIARDNNIGVSTLHKWLQRYCEKKGVTPLSVVTPNSMRELSSNEKFNHLIAINGLDDVRLGEYCRENGLYSYQLEEWRTAFMSKTDDSKKNQYKAELRVLKQDVKKLDRDLKRKDKALAEVSALLILKKKQT